MELFVVLVSGLALGCLHAFDVDHVVAVSALTGRSPSRWSAARMGAMWGLGHSGVLFLVGALLVFFRLSIPSPVQEGAELLVGFLLVAVGLWTLRDYVRRRNIHMHRHVHGGTGHVHVHSHDDDPGHRHEHSHSLFALGAVHGLAGSGSVVVLIPVALADAPGSALTFLVVFGAGSTAAMAAFSLVLTAAFQRSRSAAFIATARAMAGVASLGVGFVWIAERMF